MYQVMLGNQILYYPGSDSAVIYETKLNLEVGLAGEFTFKVPSQNPCYSSLAMGTLITIYKNGKEYWRGEIRDIKYDFSKTAEVYCLEDLAWLGEEYLEPTHITNQTYTQRLTAVLTTYNSVRPDARKFQVGDIYGGSSTCNWKTEYEWSILDDIRQCICRDNLYVKVRRTTSGSTVTRHIDVKRLQEYGKTTGQKIEFGYNLLDYLKEADFGNLVNVLTPYGDEVVDSDGNTQYKYDDYAQHIQGTTITNTSSVNTYGRHAKAVVFDGVTNTTTLNNLASAYLARYSVPQVTLEVTAIDLAEIDNVDTFDIGDRVIVVAKPFGADLDMYLTQMVIDLQNPDKNTITLSNHVSNRTLTSQIQTAMDAIEEIPAESSVLKAAKENALRLLLDETQGGHVVFEYYTPSGDTAKYMEAINICNAATIEESTKRWRWSQNGLGYMERNSKNDPWPTGANVPVAITYDGQIVADRITTGAMSATRIRGGSLFLGGTGQGAYKSGSLYIYDANSTGQGATDKLVGSWTSSGISVKSGTVTLGNKQTLTDANTGVYIGADGISAGANSVFKVTSAGVLNATSATIKGSITAESGKIGSATSAWNIGAQSIYNGCTGVHNGSAGTYVGIDGIRNNDSNNHYVRITGGQIASNNCDLSGAITATSGAIGGVNIANNANEHGIDSGLGADDAVKMVRESGFMWAHKNGNTWGKFNTLLNAPPHYTGYAAITAYVHNGVLCVDNDGTLADDGDQSSNKVIVTPYTVASWDTSIGADEVIWVRRSDKRLKDDIEDIGKEEIADFFEKIQPKKFRFKDLGRLNSEHLHYGVIAQDIVEDIGEEIEFTGKNDKGFYHINYEEFHGMELAGIKELMQTVKSQQSEIELLKEEIKLLKEAVHGKH